MILASSSWCTQCKPVKQFIEENNLDVEIVDIDENFDFARQHGIRGIPALVVDNELIVGQTNIMNKLRGVE